MTDRGHDLRKAPDGTRSLLIFHTAACKKEIAVLGESFVMPTVLVAGAAVQDFIYRFDAAPARGTKGRAKDFTSIGGGSEERRVGKEY